MRKTLLLAALLTLGLTPQAMAHEYTLSLARPYAIVTTCDDDNLNCESRMDYAPGEHRGPRGRRAATGTSSPPSPISGGAIPEAGMSNGAPTATAPMTPTATPSSATATSATAATAPTMAPERLD